jgi:hypothetical protein
MNCTSAHWTDTASEEVLQNTSTPVDTRGYRDMFRQEYPPPGVQIAQLIDTPSHPAP